MKTSIAILAAAVLSGCIPAFAEPVVLPYATPTEVGLQFNLVSMFRQRATPVPTRTRYIEEYRQTVYGPVTAQANGAIDDTSGRVVAVEEVEVPPTWKEKVKGHFEANYGKYIGGGVAAIAYLIYENQKSSGGSGDKFALYSNGGDITVNSKNQSDSRTDSRTTTTTTSTQTGQ